MQIKSKDSQAQSRICHLILEETELTLSMRDAVPHTSASIVYVSEDETDSKFVVGRSVKPLTFLLARAKSLHTTDSGLFTSPVDCPLNLVLVALDVIRPHVRVR